MKEEIEIESNMRDESEGDEKEKINITDKT